MASQKKRRKAAHQAHKQRRPRTGPFVHADGDRRRRGEMADAIKQIKLLKQLGLPLPEPEGEPAD